MRINLAKVFPLSSQKAGLEVLVINTKDIVNLEDSSLREDSLDVVQVGDLSYKFNPVDNGLVHLNNIRLAEQVSSLLANNSMQLQESQTHVTEIDSMCKKTLAFYKRRFN